MNENDHRYLEELKQVIPAETQEIHPGREGGHSDSVGLITLLIDRMSGRWRYALPLAILLAGVFGSLGYIFADTYYQSTGLIRVAPKITPLVRDTIETGVIPNYPGHIQTQATLIMSSRVRERALHSLNLDDLPWSTREEALNAIQQNLQAQAERRSELVVVTYRADSPGVAKKVLDAVLEAYDELYASADGEDFVQNKHTLNFRREQFRAQKQRKELEIQNLLGEGEYVVSDFNALIQHRAMHIEHLESEIRIRETTLAHYDAKGLEEPAATLDDLENLSGEELLAALSVDYRELEAFDQELASIARQREQANLRLGQARNRYTPEHRAYRVAEREVQSLNRMYQQRAAAIVRDFLNDPTVGANAKFHSAHEIEIMRREVEHLKQQARDMGRTQLKLNQLRAELTDIENDYNAINERLKQMELESDAIRSGNISIAAMGDYPSGPRQDRRHILAALGVMGGFGAGFGFFFLIGSVDRRTYAVTQLRQSEFGDRLLGVLPSLPRRSGDLETAGVAAHCIHQIRNQIEAVRTQNGSPVITISSPFQGDGKTSLTMALGASYAAAGYRTIMVDCDLVGRSLTNHLMMTEKPGLQEALAVGKTNGNARQLNMNNLSVLPVGNDPHFGPERVRKSDLDRLFKQLRSAYDVVLVDTGPLYGSIESLPVAAASDGVVLAVRRGGRFSGLQSCIRSLQCVKSSCLGIVLNHAQASDCDRYVSKSKLSELQTSGARQSHQSSRKRSTHRNALLEAVTISSSQDDE